MRKDHGTFPTVLFTMLGGRAAQVLAPVSTSISCTSSIMLTMTQSHEAHGMLVTFIDKESTKLIMYCSLCVLITICTVNRKAKVISNKKKGEKLN